VTFEQRGEPLHQGVPGPEHLEEDLLLEALERLALFDDLPESAHGTGIDVRIRDNNRLDEICDNR
jgi:hypothetical protein